MQRESSQNNILNPEGSYGQEKFSAPSEQKDHDSKSQPDEEMADNCKNKISKVQVFQTER